MTMMNVYDCAASLYDGGWRPEDAEQMMSEYGFTADETEAICSEMARLAA